MHKLVFVVLLLSGCAALPRVTPERGRWYGVAVLEEAPPGQVPRIAYVFGVTGERWPGRHAANIINDGDVTADYVRFFPPPPAALDEEIRLYPNGGVHFVTWGLHHHCRVLLSVEAAQRGGKVIQVQVGAVRGRLLRIQLQPTPENFSGLECPEHARSP